MAWLGPTYLMKLQNALDISSGSLITALLCLKCKEMPDISLFFNQLFL